MTVLDSSGAVDYLLGIGAAGEVASLWRAERTLAAPDVLTFEVLAVLRRAALSGEIDAGRATAAVDDYGDLSLTLFPSHALRIRAWEWRERLTAADALFAALAELLEEPLATKDRALARTAEQLGLAVVELGA